MKGIDISEHNGNIDFTKVKSDGIDFVIIRLGWIGNTGNNTLDKKFWDYYLSARDVGLKVGFYIYSYCKSVTAIKNGAEWTIKQLRGKISEMPIFLDMEDNSIRYLGKTELTNQCKAFCDIIKNNNFNTGIYANKDWFINYLDVNELQKYYKIWLAEWNGKNNHTANFRVDLWQYTSAGKVNGINTRVDMNKCLQCENNSSENIVENKESDFDMKIYQNGTTKEIVYQDCNCTKQIGYLHPHETAECYGKINNVALIVYNIDNSNNKKTGFVKWLGGIK